MSISVLYVYSPTTFSTEQADTTIESIDGSQLTVDQVTHLITLQPGVYRLPSDANITVANGASGAAPPTATAGPMAGDCANSTLESDANHDLVPMPRTKTGWPDPPARAVQQLQFSAADLEAFARDAGEADEI